MHAPHVRFDLCARAGDRLMTTTEHPREHLPTGPSTISVSGIAHGPSDADTEGIAVQRVRTLLVSAAGYLLLSLFLWWHVWSAHPTSTTTCGCGDSSLFTWFLTWPAYALSHGFNPLYSTALFHPIGVNLLSNTAEVGIAVVLAPITWLFGPIATLNVALTLSPVLSALAMFVLVRRWTSWTPAAFVAGLAYGFSPFVLIALTDAHLMLAMAPIPPLLVACFDELLVRQRRRPLTTGVVLGVLVTVQFFIGTELLILTAIAIALGVALMVLYAVPRHLDILRRKARHALIALTAAATTAAVLLAYPAWFALAGPAHLAGPIWGPDSFTSYGGTNLRSYLLPSAPSAAAAELGHRFGGYQAPTLSGQYLGIGFLAVLLVGTILWRRDRRIWLFAAVGAVALSLSAGLALHNWTVWRLFVRFPLMENIIPSRFLVITYLTASVILGLILDHTYSAMERWKQTSQRFSERGTGGGRWAVGAILAVALAAVALVPIAWYYSSGVPFTTQAVVVPAWFRTVAPHLRGHQVILAFPVPFDLYQSAMTWQAEDDMSFAMVGGGGPGSIPQRAGKELAGQTYIGNLSIAGGPQAITRQEILAVRQALDGWGVTTVVVPDPAPLPIYERLHEVRITAMLLSAATGQRPVRQADAWVWTGVEHAGPPVLASATWSTVCGAGPADGTVVSITRSTQCVLAAASAHP